MKLTLRTLWVVPVVVGLAAVTASRMYRAEKEARAAEWLHAYEPPCGEECPCVTSCDRACCEECDAYPRVHALREYEITLHRRRVVPDGYRIFARRDGCQNWSVTAVATESMLRSLRIDSSGDIRGSWWGPPDGGSAIYETAPDAGGGG